MDFIPYRQLADTDIITPLYNDYLTHFEKIAPFFLGDYRDGAAWKSKLGRLQNRTYPRAKVQRILNEQNREYHSGIKSLANIDLLGNENCFAVVTGQQVGMFGGPLYTFYKAVTAVKLAEKLSAEHPDFQFVPVFWLEGEDHDIDEVTSMSFISMSNEIATVKYVPGGRPSDKTPGAAGSIVIDESIETFFQQVEAQLPKTDYSAGLLGTMRGYYKPGSTLLQAFTGFFNHVYEDSGLVFLNPNHTDLKRLLSPLLQREIESNAEASKRVIQTSAELEEQYHAQIKAKALNLFMFHKGGRHLIEPSDSGDYFLRNTRQRYTKEELLVLATSSPEIFSSNVVTRPLCQDTLLPTVAYVAGPGEIAYFAQLKPVYEFYGIDMPIIYPRASMTLVEEKVHKVLEKFSLELAELFGDADAILAKVSEQVSEVKVDALFASLERRIAEAVNEARFGIQQIDPTLNGAVDGTLQKMMQMVEVLKQKTQKAQQQKEDISLKQIRKAVMNIFPAGNFQEREFGAVPYLNKYGPDFVRWVSNELVIDRFQHQVTML